MSDRRGVERDRTPTAWVRLVVVVNPDQVDVAADALWLAGAAGIEERRAGGRVVLIGGFHHAASADAANVLLTGRGFPAGKVDPVVDDGLGHWRRWAVPVLAGRCWITPTWVDPPDPAPGHLVVLIDPGPTFGSGSHPTTRLVVATMDALVAPAATVLDVGTGSGVLAVGAALLGAASVVAIDVDPHAPATAADNAARNGVDDVVDASTRPLSEVVASHPPFDLVVANLLAPVIEQLASDLVQAVAPHGTLLVSGLLTDRWEPTAAALAPLEVVSVVDDEGWTALVLTHPPASSR